MIETVENAAQFVVVTVCCGISVFRSMRRRSRLWVLMSLFYGTFLLGLLYWLLYLLFYGMTPQFRYISELSWYTAYLFLFMILQFTASPDERQLNSKLPLLMPVFATGMCILYAQFSPWLSNIMSAFVMSLLLYHAFRGMLYYRKKKLSCTRRTLCRLTMLFCTSEYCMWTFTCFYWSDRLSNPYFWFDILQTVCFPLFIPVVARLEADRKAVDAA